MNNPDMQFLKYTAVTGEKHLGIAVMRWLGKIILRFKVMESTQPGGGYWVTAGSAKIGVKVDGKDNYEEWYQIDSSYDRDMVKEFVLYHVEQKLKESRGSIYGSYQSAPAQAPSQSYGAPAQQMQQGQSYGQQAPQQAYNPSPSVHDYNPPTSQPDYGQPPF